MAEQAVALPATLDETSAVLADAAARDATVAIRGAGLGWASLDADLIVDTAKQDQVIEHVAGDLVARVQAGATMGHVAEELARHGQRLSLDVRPGITVGGMLATGTAGPLRFRYGPPRDLLIGITVVRPDGVVARSGGKVVKNVAGYDLGKLFTGSHGSLGLIAEATFRLHPLPQSVSYLTAAFPATASAAQTNAATAIAAAANSPLQPAAVELDWPAGGPLTVGVLLEGTESGVAERARLMADLLRSAPGIAPDVTASADPPAWWGQLPASGCVVRTTFWLSRLGDVLGLIADSGVRCWAGGSAGAGLLYLCPEDDGGLGDVAPMLRGLLGNRGDAHVLTEPWAPADPLMRAVKDQFDPKGRFG
jgi:glycolate oxidase FAD binding subunit